LPTEADVNISPAYGSAAAMCRTMFLLPLKHCLFSGAPDDTICSGCYGPYRPKASSQKNMQGMNKKDYWDAYSMIRMDLIARLPRIAAYIYRSKYKNGNISSQMVCLDWAGNFAHMMGYEDESFKELMRLYMTIHADHEGGNVSAHTTHLGWICLK
jgi:citrate synthase